jgi:cytidylate kinase
MNIITISREFGSGGRELGKRIADLLGYDYYDSEIISAVAKSSGLDEDHVAHALANQGWQAYPITFRGTLSSAGYVQSSTVPLLLKQKEVIENIAALGRDFVIIGRNADVILQKYEPFNIFVCAETRAKVMRCQERKSAEEDMTEKELIRKMRQIDKMRAQTRTIISGSQWGQRDAYHLTVNTTDWDIKVLAPAVAGFADCWFGRGK